MGGGGRERLLPPMYSSHFHEEHMVFEGATLQEKCIFPDLETETKWGKKESQATRDKDDKKLILLVRSI